MASQAIPEIPSALDWRMIFYTMAAYHEVSDHGSIKPPRMTRIITVAFDATGWYGPKPATPRRLSGSPACFIRSATASARAVLRWKLLGYFSRASGPTIFWLSVWPATMIFRSPAAGDFNTRTNSSSSWLAPGFNTASPLSKRMSVSSLLMPVSAIELQAGVSLREFGELVAEFGRQAAAAESHALELVVQSAALAAGSLPIASDRGSSLCSKANLLFAADHAVFQVAAVGLRLSISASCALVCSVRTRFCTCAAFSSVLGTNRQPGRTETAAHREAARGASS